jgi:hypothetical protein
MNQYARYFSACSSKKLMQFIAERKFCFRRHQKNSNKLNYLHDQDFIFYFFFNISHMEKCCRACDENFPFFWCVFKINLIMSESKVELYTQEERRIHKCWLTTKYLFLRRETAFLRLAEFWPNFPSSRKANSNIFAFVFSPQSYRFQPPMNFLTKHFLSSLYISLHSERERGKGGEIWN